MNKEGRNEEISSISNEDLESLSDEDLVALDGPVSNPVFKKRINKLIGQRNTLRTEKEGWTSRKKEMLEEMTELNEYKQLKELANSDPRIAKAIMNALQTTLGDERMDTKTIPRSIRETGMSGGDKRMSMLEQRQDNLEIEKLFDNIGVKQGEIEKLSEFCEQQGINMKNKVLLEMAYSKMFGKPKDQEPDSSSVSGIVYGNEPIRTVKDAVALAIKIHGTKEKRKR